MRWGLLVVAAVLLLAAYGVSRRWPTGHVPAAVVAGCSGGAFVLAACSLGRGRGAKATPRRSGDVPPRLTASLPPREPPAPRDAEKPRQFVDSRSVWRVNGSGRIGFEWAEVSRVIGYKVATISVDFTCVMVAADDDRGVEFLECWPGFHEVVAALTARLPGIAPDWLDAVEAVGTYDPPVEVWQWPTS